MKIALVIGKALQRVEACEPALQVTFVKVVRLVVDEI